MIRKRPGLFLACVLAAIAPIIGPLLFRAVVLYFVGRHPLWPIAE
jgi:hypothetical protein